MIITSDSFTDSNGTNLASHTGEIGATWTLGFGSVQSKIQGNRLQHYENNYTERHIYYSSGVPGAAEYDVEGVYRHTGALGVDGYGGIVARFDPSTKDGYVLTYDTYTTFRRWALRTLSAGVFGTILGTYSHTPTADTDYAIKLEIRDAAKKFYLDGVERISSADNSITATGRGGIYSYGDMGTQYLDNFTITDLLAAGNSSNYYAQQQ